MENKGVQDHLGLTVLEDSLDQREQQESLAHQDLQ